MLLDPINAVISFEFYRRVASQAWWRTALYLGYLSLLLSLAGTAALKIHGGPHIDSTFVWLEKSFPPLTFVNGKLTSTLTAPLVLRHPEYDQIGIAIDTNRLEPVTLKTLEEAKAQAYVTSTAFYMLQRPGELRVYDFSKAADPKPLVIDAGFWESARAIFNRVFYPAVFASALVFLLFWNVGWTLTYALMGLLLNGLAEAGLAFGSLVPIALYAQTAACAVQGLTMVAGVAIPKWPLVSLVVTGGYIWLAIKKVREPAPAS
ncbi:MAG: DUF1189 family protein [Elusimicrobia bacterium]|nr:DUF1189 family protein [Elusimicrobiota bacterium]